jgi:hypothetical protein
MRELLHPKVSASSVQHAAGAMDAFFLLFEHIVEHRILLCSSCTIAVPSAQLHTHLRGQHPKLPAARRKDVAAIARTLSDLAWEPLELRPQRNPCPHQVDKSGSRCRQRSRIPVSRDYQDCCSLLLHIWLTCLAVVGSCRTRCAIATVWASGVG